MDLDQIGSRLANLTMYDVKQFYTAAKNYALNVSEIEAKVNEATSDDPWGASSTLMQDIAAATNNFQDFNEIMPAIYRNFMEKEAREWRQIYKALQLLEYIIKHGSERVVDDARSHLGTIKILRNFHYIDESGKDQGINVRNRAKEIAELLSDVERIRVERRKARANKQKYQGASNSDFIPGSGTGRYGGFGSDSLYNEGGGGSGSMGGNGTSSAPRRDSYDEYDAGDDEDRRKPTPAARRSAQSSTTSQPAAKKEAAKVVDLFSFDDDEPAPASTAAAASDGFDDFDEFQAAPSATTSPATTTRVAPSAPAPASVAKTNVFDFLSEGSAPARSSVAAAPVASNNRPPLATTPLSPSFAPLQPQRTVSSASMTSSGTTTAQAKSNNTSSLNFDDLWASSAGKTSGTAGAPANKAKMTMAEMAKQKSSSAVWGAGTPTSTQAKKSDPFDFL